ncbi:MAG: hypothetical protein A3A82_00385 [Candidatus Pacebacteria bacterium RIFCSPLOWO2_01_FULL_47_12]|nr:MAG: hypothetical protein A3J60_00690 [Candidatus Pacebacteria bacterium RIFCSPHIGHO2_02_FULL_46_9]OGJ39247.1 MAG: hypothetical protein A3A82_00385 [Candidatus Pacebacteria bacterium RIFCSPLOWO2_01_FULL_47_12]
MNRTDFVYLADMLGMIDKIEQFVSGVDFESFAEDERTQFAVFHALEVIGEAANKLSKEFAEKNPSVSVREAVELRNILIHGYDLIRLEVVWKTIEENLPELKQQLLVSQSHLGSVAP